MIKIVRGMCVADFHFDFQGTNILPRHKLGEFIELVCWEDKRRCFASIWLNLSPHDAKNAFFQ